MSVELVFDIDGQTVRLSPGRGEAIRVRSFVNESVSHPMTLRMLGCGAVVAECGCQAAKYRRGDRPCKHETAMAELLGRVDGIANVNGQFVHLLTHQQAEGSSCVSLSTSGT